MQTDAEIASLAAAASAAQEFAFVSWDGSDGRRACPLATFGSRGPQTLSLRAQARLLQKAGAVAMLLANNTREEPLAAFTMGKSPEELEQNEKSGAEPITMPCIMMCLRDVRELFQKFRRR
ncbi:Transient receptor potential channel pyrexia [Phytophthora cinnamomi]|uniref:Transient receptor potential channel pyrexia n=1 Tax=Phytophthora cinnamomi TaxID=4785 RepID=UPI00355A7CF9|nr:Transient receptor potential channel pyrexia [Phytophthora cinnamomi]